MAEKAGIAWINTLAWGIAGRRTTRASPRGFRGTPLPEFCRRSSARGRRAAKPMRPPPLGVIRRKGAKAEPLKLGELANTLEGMGRCEERALPCPTNAPGPSGAEAQGGQAAEWTGNPKGGGARLRGERGAPRFLQPRHRSRRASAPCGFPPFGGFEFGGGIRKGGFPKGGKLRGELAFPGRPPRSLKRSVALPKRTSPPISGMSGAYSPR